MKKLALFCLLILSTPALAQNLVDREQNPSGGGILNFFGGGAQGSTGSFFGKSTDRGCEPEVNAAGNTVYVRREGCPPPR